MLIAAGALIKTGSLPLWPIMIGAVLGAVLGDTVSYWIGQRFGGRLAGIWPFTRNPDLLAGGMQFFHRHGGKSVFIGRFFGPVRAVIPLAAGIMRMSPRLFWMANVTSALVWAPMLLLAGDVIADAGERLVGSENTVLLLFGGMTLFGIRRRAMGRASAPPARKAEAPACPEILRSGRKPASSPLPARPQLTSPGRRGGRLLRLLGEARMRRDIGIDMGRQRLGVGEEMVGARGSCGTRS